jgi:hypothetical protein
VSGEFNLDRADVDRVLNIAREARGAWEGDEAAEAAADILIGFCELLLGAPGAYASLDNFLTGEDMDSFSAGAAR